MGDWRALLDYLLNKVSQTHSCFFCEISHVSEFEMLEVVAILCQLRNNIIFKREAVLSHFTKDKLSEATISKVMTNHEFQELVGNCGFTVQSLDYKAFKRPSHVN